MESMCRLHGPQQIPMHPPDVEKTTFITPHGAILLQCNAFWLEECRSDLLEAGDPNISITVGQDHGSLHQRYDCQIQRTPRSLVAPTRNL